LPDEGLFGPAFLAVGLHLQERSPNSIRQNAARPHPLVREANVMASEDRSDWRELCKQAAVETDLSKLLELTAEIIRLIDEQRARPVQIAM
jgi:hypothetical protein